MDINKRLIDKYISEKTVMITFSLCYKKFIRCMQDDENIQWEVMK